MVRRAALALTVVTGFSGLAYEVTWQKYLAILLGSHSEATAAVLGLFLGGLALGYRLFGVVTRRRVERARAAGRPPHLLILYGSLEGAIGAYALIFPFFFEAARGISFFISPGSGGLGFALDVALSGALIGPPAVLMGATIPVLTQALARSLADATRFHALVYGFNTAGAFAGALAAGYWLTPALGLVGVLQLMGAVNLAVGALFIALGLRESGASGAAGDVAAAPAPIEGHAGLLRGDYVAFAVVALLAGFAMMAIQTVLIRLGGLAFGASQFTFSMVVAVFVLCIAVGSLAVSALPRIPKALIVANFWALVVVLCVLYRPLQNSPYWAHVLRSLFSNDPANFYTYHLAALLAVLCVIGLPVALSGAVLPLIFHHLRRQLGDLGGLAGRLYSWNTVGSFLGALLGGYLLLYWFDLHVVYRAALVALAVAGLLVTIRVFEQGRLVATVLVFIPVLAYLALLPPWSGKRLASGLFRFRQPQPMTFAGPDALFASHYPNMELKFYEDDPALSVAVFEREIDHVIERSVVTNGKPDSSLRAEYVTTALIGLLPALFAEKLERAFVIGYGTGVTVGELAALRSMREVVVAEISRGVIRAAPLFDYGNLEASKHPAVRIQPADAYRALLRSEGSFDIIASEPSNPWVTGVEMLYSREFLEAARNRLAAGGVYSQWLHSYEIDKATISMVLRTYAAVFDQVSVWYTMGQDFVLLGFREPQRALSLDRLQARVAQPDLAEGLRRCKIHSLPELVAHELLPLGVVHAAALSGDLHTLLHPRLSYLAARAFYRGMSTRLPTTAGLETARVGARNSLVRRLAAQNGGRLPEPERERMVDEICHERPVECLTLLAHWTHEVPRSPRLKRIKTRILEDPVRGPAIPIALVEPFASLYGGEPFTPPNGNPLDAALVQTERFTTHYHHAAPFSRSALAALWKRCEADPKQRKRCLRERARLEEAIGDLAAGEGA